MKKFLPLILITVGLALIIASIVLSMYTNPNVGSWKLGLSASDWITLTLGVVSLLVGLGAGIVGWKDLFKKEKPTPSATKIEVKEGSPQISTGDHTRNIQAQIYIENQSIQQSLEHEAPKVINLLPASPADFTGREKEVGQILMDFENHKGVTINGLTGMGGVGKTALALVIGHQLAEKYPYARIFLDLGGISEKPMTPVEAMKKVILDLDPSVNFESLSKKFKDLEDKEKEKAIEKEITNRYQNLLDGKKVLLILDNARTASQIEPLIPPDSCGVLITSRWLFSVPGLQSHRIDVLTELEAKDFLLTLCPRIGDKAEGLAKTCGHLPLALRIAGGFLQVNKNWSVEKYLTQLNNRNQTLAFLEISRDQVDLGRVPYLVATFETSYQHLTQVQQRYWKMLGIYRRSFSLKDAASIWGTDEITTPNLLSIFCQYNLLEYDEKSETYRLHDLLVDFARQKIEQLIGDAKENGDLPEQVFWIKLLAMAYKNDSDFPRATELYQQAWTIAQKINDRNTEATILNNLGSLYREVGELDRAIESNEEGLIIGKEINDYRIKLGALTGLGNSYESLGESRRSIKYKEDALAIAEESGDRGFVARILNNLGNSYEDFDPLHAIKLYNQSLEIAREIGDRLTEGNALTNAGIAYYETDDCETALEYHKRAQTIFEEIGDLDGVGAALSNAGNCYLEIGEIDQAIDCFLRFLTIARRTRYRYGEANALGNLGRADAALGKLDEAQEYLEAQLRIAQDIGDRMGEGNSLDEIGDLYTTRNQPDIAIDYIEQALSIFREIRDKSGEGYALWNLSKAYAKKGEREKAKLLANQALQVLVPIKSHYAAKVKNWLAQLELE